MVDSTILALPDVPSGMSGPPAFASEVFRPVGRERGIATPAPEASGLRCAPASHPGADG
jgi:hypothetical protein